MSFVKWFMGTKHGNVKKDDRIHSYQWHQVVNSSRQFYTTPNPPKNAYPTEPDNEEILKKAQNMHQTMHQTSSCGSQNSAQPRIGQTLPLVGLGSRTSPLQAPNPGSIIQRQDNQQRICWVCSGLTVNNIVRPGGVALHKSVAGFMSAAFWGCVICNLLNDALLSEGIDIKIESRLHGVAIQGFHFRIFKHRQHSNLSIIAGQFDSKLMSDGTALQEYLENFERDCSPLEYFSWLHYDSKNLVLYTSSGYPCSQYIPDVSPLEKDNVEPWSAKYFNDIKISLNQCISSHVACPSLQDTDNPRLPNRILYVGTRDEPVVQLFEPKSLKNGHRANYAALSYRWGIAQSLRLLSTNVEIFKSGISESTLPATILQAVQITRQLDLQFLWVDALCIMQDSKEDWKSESLLMASIYQKAWVTIGAGQAEGVDEGVIVQRPSVPQRPTAQIPFVSDDGTPLGYGTLQFWRERKHEPNTLDSRGWCFQEERLSPRFLLFSDNKWELRCQNIKVISLHAQTRLEHAFFGTKDPDEDKWPAHLRQEQGLSTNWQSVVYFYSQRDLTMASDRLVAIAGLAKRFQELTGYDYLAGCWAQTILSDIMWERTDEPTSLEDPRRYGLYRAPSWSWASVDGAILYPWGHEKQKYEPVATLKNIQTFDKDPLTGEHDPFGWMAGASLELQARMRPGRISLSYRLPVEWLVGELQFVATNPETGDIHFTESPTFNLDYYAKPPNLTDTIWATGTVYTLEVMQDAGLLIEEAGNRPGCYRRIGRYRIPLDPTGYYPSTMTDGSEPTREIMVDEVLKNQKDVDCDEDLMTAKLQRQKRVMYGDWWYSGGHLGNITLI